MAYGNPTAHALTALSAAVGSWVLPIRTGLLTVWNRTGTGEVFITLDGTTPVVAADNQWFIPAAITSIEIPVLADTPGAEAAPTITLQAISSAALSLWISAT